MNRTIYLFSLFLLGFSKVFAQWNPQIPDPKISINDIYCSNANTSIAVGWSGKITKTTDGGITWQTIESGTEKHLTSISSPGNENFIAVGEGGVILKSSDGGTTWSIQQAPENMGTTKVYYYNQNVVYIAGTGIGNFLKSVNGGESWEVVTTNYEGTLMSLQFISDTQGFAIGHKWNRETLKTNVTVLKTVDGGLTWTTIYTPVEGTTINATYFSNINTGFAVGNNGTIMRTTDGGTSWITQNSGSSNNLTSVHFVTQNNGYVVGALGTILRTTNKGNTWTTQQTDKLYAFNKVFCLDMNTIYISVGGNTIVKTTNGGN